MDFVEKHSIVPTAYSTDMNVQYDALTDCVPCVMYMMALMYASTSIFHFVFPVHEIQCVSFNSIDSLRYSTYIILDVTPTTNQIL